MSSHLKREQIKEWFIVPEAKFEGLPIIIISGAVGLLLFYMNANGIAALCLVFAGVFGLIKYMSYTKQLNRYNNRPHDSQMDTWLEEDIKELEKKALIKCGIDESELVREFELIDSIWGFHSSIDRFWRTGNDKILRTSCHEVCILNFTANQLIAYSCILDLLSGNTLNESTDEYFYKDVVSMSTKVESKVVWGYQLDDAETLNLFTSGGTSINIVLNSDKLLKELNSGGSMIPTTKSERAIAAVRKMLREKKSN